MQSSINLRERDNKEFKEKRNRMIPSFTWRGIKSKIFISSIFYLHQEGNQQKIIIIKK